MKRVLAGIVGAMLALPWGWHLLLVARGMALFAAAGLLSYALVPAAIAVARRVGAVDVPDARRMHDAPTPRMGGLAILAAANLVVGLHFDFSLPLKGAIISGAIVAAVSAWDDARSLPAAVKLVAQIAAAGVLWVFGVRLDFAPEAWGAWGEAIEFFVFVCWMVGIANAFNFLDGLNGLAASLAMLICGLMAILAIYTHQSYMALLVSVIAGAAAGFLPDNARFSQPARCFMGDVGSIYLGWMMAAAAVMGAWSDLGPLFAYGAPLLIFSVMIFDMIYTTIARIARGDVRSFREWIEYTGKDHLHHRLLMMGMSPKAAVWSILAVAWITGTAGIALVRAPAFSAILLLAQG
ncbi:MAG: undecaprenyl/decaprenyl-phosphate alpha-N-acetylglucosaminyl 1-phosphate transferase, partial [Zetaproteobacteria bacterium]